MKYELENQASVAPDLALAFWLAGCHMHFNLHHWKEKGKKKIIKWKH